MNVPPSMRERIEQAVSAVNCDTRLEEALVALDLAREALEHALDATTEITEGIAPDIAGLDDKIENALAAITEVMSDDYSVTRRPRILKRLVTHLQKHGPTSK